MVTGKRENINRREIASCPYDFIVTKDLLRKIIYKGVLLI